MLEKFRMTPEEYDYNNGRIRTGEVQFHSKLPQIYMQNHYGFAYGDGGDLAVPFCNLLNERLGHLLSPKERLVKVMVARAVEDTINGGESDEDSIWSQSFNFPEGESQQVINSLAPILFPTDQIEARIEFVTSGLTVQDIGIKNDIFGETKMLGEKAYLLGQIFAKSLKTYPKFHQFATIPGPWKCQLFNRMMTNFVDYDDLTADQDVVSLGLRPFLSDMEGIETWYYKDKKARRNTWNSSLIGDSFYLPQKFPYSISRDNPRPIVRFNTFKGNNNLEFPLTRFNDGCYLPSMVDIVPAINASMLGKSENIIYDLVEDAQTKLHEQLNNAITVEESRNSALSNLLKIISGR